MTVTLDNYEQYLLSYVDHELDDSRTAELMAFLAAHPDLRAELQALESTRLDSTEKLVFEGKATLYRAAVSPRGFHLRRPLSWAAAAALAGLCVGYGILKSDHQPTIEPGTAPAVVVETAVPTPKAPTPARAKTDAHTYSSAEAARAPSPNPAAVAAAQPPAPASTGSGHPADTLEAQLPVLPPLPAPQLVVTTLSAPRMEAVAMPEEKSDRHNSVAAAPFRPADKLALVAESLDQGRRQLDEKITSGLSGISQKAATLADKLGQKQIRIGHLTIAFNE